MSQLCLYRHVLWKWCMLWSYSRRKYTVYTTTAITSIQMLISVHQFVFYFGWDEKILTTIWSTAVKFSPNIRQGTTRSGSGDPSTFLHASPQLLSCLLWNVLQCFNSWPNTYRNPIQSSWMNKCWDMFVSSCWDFNLIFCRCADGPALFRQQNPLYRVKRSFSLLGSVATNKAKIED